MHSIFTPHPFTFSLPPYLLPSPNYSFSFLFLLSLRLQLVDEGSSEVHHIMRNKAHPLSLRPALHVLNYLLEKKRGGGGGVSGRERR